MTTDYEYHTDAWGSPLGAAFNVVAEDWIRYLWQKPSGGYDMGGTTMNERSQSLKPQNF